MTKSSQKSGRKVTKSSQKSGRKVTKSSDKCQVSRLRAGRGVGNAEERTLARNQIKEYDTKEGRGEEGREGGGGE